MDAQDKPRLEITDRQGNRIIAAEGQAAEGAIATLNGRRLAPNRGTSLNLEEGLADRVAAASDHVYGPDYSFG